MSDWHNKDYGKGGVYMTEVSIIIPTYNEKGNINILLDRIHNSMNGTDYETVIVDDNSPDGTAGLIDELSKKYPVRLIIRKDKRGLASAVVTGLQNAKGNIFIVMDADLQHPPEKIPSFIQEINNGADITIANRYADKDGFDGLGLHRKIISKCANYPAKILFRKLADINDIQSGFFALKSDVIKGVDLQPIGYKILLEILILGNYNNVKELSYKFAKRENGKTKLGPKVIVEYLLHISNLAYRTGEFNRFTKYCTVGAIGIAVNTAVLFLLTNVLGIFYLISSILAHEISIIGNFIMNDNWTFKGLTSSEKGPYDLIYRAVRYNMAKISGILLSISILFILTQFLSIPYLYSNVIAIMAGVFWGYSTSMIVVWRH